MMDHDELEERIVLELAHHIGETNAVERWALVRKIFGPGADIPPTDDNHFDRRIRKVVELMRGKGHLICNLGNGRGWFLAGSEEEYRAFRSVYGSHAFPIMDTIHAMDKAATELWPNALQPRLL
jgi:hypothetical protein